MDRWIITSAVVSIIIVKLTLSLDVFKLCKTRPSPLGGEELFCHNASLLFFKKFDVSLNRTHWLTCENCSLEIIDENVFNIPNKNLTFLHLIKSKIQSVRAFAFNKFTLLKGLNLRDNHIEEIHSTSFINLNKLNRLDLSHNRLKILSNNLFEEVPNLDLLNLNYNEIFLIQPESFAGLKHLKYLYLSNNEIEKLEGHTFKNLPNLLLLYLENNKILQIDSFAFANLNQLHSLYLNNNSLNFLVQYNFKALHSLTDLQLRDNNLIEIQTSSFNGLNNLRTLYLGKNKLRKIRPYGFVGLNKLQNLELMDNRFEHIELEHFVDLTSLNMLWLQKNRISNITVGFRADSMNALVSLGLSENNLTSFNYKLLFNKMPNIKDIFVWNNSWKCEFLVNMFNYMSEQHVNLCMSSDCSVNKTKDHIEEICMEKEEKKEDFDGDFVTTEGSDWMRFSLFLISVNVLLLIFL